MFRVELQGMKEINALINKMRRNGDDRLQKMLFEGALNTKSEAARSIQAKQSSGRTYQRRTVRHTASLPNNPPNTDTGALVRNITTKKIAKGYDVGSRAGAPHGFWLEFGTSQMAARPWLKPAFERIIKPLIDKYSRGKLI